MQYKTIVLELINDQPELAIRLRGSKTMLTTVETFATELKTIHEEWKTRLSQSKPASDPSQVNSEALELAIQEIRDRLPSGSATDEAEGPSLDGAMSFLRKHSPLA